MSSKHRSLLGAVLFLGKRCTQGMGGRAMVRLRNLASGIAFIGLPASAAISCGGPSAGASSVLGRHPAPAEVVPTGSSEKYTRTIVRIQPDGRQQITNEPIAPQRALGSTALRTLDDCPPEGVQGTVTCFVHVDDTCAQADFWMFDQVRYAGNELCVFGDLPGSQLGLSTVTRGAPICFELPRGTECFNQTWSGAVRSWSAGTEAGVLGTDYTDVLTAAPFGPWDFEATASPAAKSAQTLWLEP
jgi:hypothetical protein